MDARIFLMLVASTLYAGCSNCTTQSGVDDTSYGAATITATGLPGGADSVMLSSSGPSVDDHGYIQAFATAPMATMAVFDFSDELTERKVSCDLQPVAVALAALDEDLRPLVNALSDAQTFTLACTGSVGPQDVIVSGTATGVELPRGVALTFTLKYDVKLALPDGTPAEITAVQSYAVASYSNTECPTDDNQGAGG